MNPTLGQWMGRKLCAPGAVQRRGMLGERRRVEVEVHEDQATPGFHPHRKQAVVAGIEISGGAEIGGGPQASVQRIAPAVVAAGEGLATAPCPVRNQGAGAVAADVVETGQLALRIAHHDDRRAANHVGQVVARLGQARGVADELPGAPQDPQPVCAERVFPDVAFNRQHGVF